MIKFDFKYSEVITSTRDGGKSSGKYSSLNLAYDVGDFRTKVDENREIFFKQNYINASKTAIICPENCPVYPIIYTRDKEMSVAILHSDSLPIFFEVRGKTKMIGAIQITTTHTIQKTLDKTIKDLIKYEKLNPNTMYFYIGPSLSFSHNLIGKRDVKKLDKLGLIEGVKCTDKKYFLDENLLAIKTLRSNNIPMENIIQSPYCTYENEKLFFSKERKTPTGKMMSVIRFK